jgi:hypothetical protein
MSHQGSNSGGNLHVSQVRQVDYATRYLANNKAFIEFVRAKLADKDSLEKSKKQIQDESFMVELGQRLHQHDNYHKRFYQDIIQKVIVISTHSIITRIPAIAALGMTPQGAIALVVAIFLLLLVQKLVKLSKSHFQEIGRRVIRGMPMDAKESAATEMALSNNLNNLFGAVADAEVRLSGGGGFMTRILNLVGSDAQKALHSQEAASGKQVRLQRENPKLREMLGVPEFSSDGWSGDIASMELEKDNKVQLLKKSMEQALETDPKLFRNDAFKEIGGEVVEQLKGELDVADSKRKQMQVGLATGCAVAVALIPAFVALGADIQLAIALLLFLVLYQGGKRLLRRYHVSDKINQALLDKGAAALVEGRYLPKEKLGLVKKAVKNQAKAMSRVLASLEGEFSEKELVAKISREVATQMQAHAQDQKEMVNEVVSGALTGEFDEEINEALVLVIQGQLQEGSWQGIIDDLIGDMQRHQDLGDKMSEAMFVASAGIMTQAVPGFMALNLQWQLMAIIACTVVLIMILQYAIPKTAPYIQAVFDKAVDVCHWGDAADKDRLKEKVGAKIDDVVKAVSMCEVDASGQGKVMAWMVQEGGSAMHTKLSGASQAIHDEEAQKELESQQGRQRPEGHVPEEHL